MGGKLLQFTKRSEGKDGADNPGLVSNRLANLVDAAPIFRTQHLVALNIHSEHLCSLVTPEELQSVDPKEILEHLMNYAGLFAADPGTLKALQELQNKNHIFSHLLIKCLGLGIELDELKPTLLEFLRAVGVNLPKEDEVRHQRGIYTPLEDENTGYIERNRRRALSIFSKKYAPVIESLARYTVEKESRPDSDHQIAQKKIALSSILREIIDAFRTFLQTHREPEDEETLWELTTLLSLKWNLPEEKIRMEVDRRLGRIPEAPPYQDERELSARIEEIADYLRTELEDHDKDGPTEEEVLKTLYETYQAGIPEVHAHEALPRLIEALERACREYDNTHEGDGYALIFMERIKQYFRLKRSVQAHEALEALSSTSP